MPGETSEISRQEPRIWLPHHNFATCVMSDVYALLDYLSGRALPPLAPSSGPAWFNRHLDGPDGSKHTSMQDKMTCETIDYDLINQSALLCRTMKIGKSLDATDPQIGSAELAFLIRARDQLNVRAAPATGISISFTIRVVQRLLGNNHEIPDDERRYIVPDKSLDQAAFNLAIFVKYSMRTLIWVLVVTVVLSTYVTCGKLLLDTRDAVNRDFGANLAAIVAEANSHSGAETGLAISSNVKYPSTQVADVPIDKFCTVFGGNVLVGENCHQREEIKERKRDINELLRFWICPFHSMTSDEKVAQWATTVTGLMGNYLLPVLYGWLGALGFVLRRLNRQLADCLLTPRDLRANHIRLLLGTVTGACIGLFVNSSTGAATLTGLGGAAVTLSASGIAFIAGYGVEGVFKMLDTLVNHLFRTTEEQKPASRA